MAKEQVTFCSLICHKFSHCCQVNLLDRETISVHWKTHQSRTRNASCTQKYLGPLTWPSFVRHRSIGGSFDHSRNPSIYNIIHWVAWTMGQTNRRPRERCSNYYSFILFIDLGHSKLFIFIFVILLKK